MHILTVRAHNLIQQAIDLVNKAESLGDPLMDLKDDNFNLGDIKNLTHLLTEENIIKKHKTNVGRYVLDTVGREIVSIGSYEKYLKQKNKAISFKKSKVNLELWNLRLNVAKSLIAIILALYGLVDIIVNIIFGNGIIDIVKNACC